MQKEAKARIKINELFQIAGWRFFDDEKSKTNIVLEIMPPVRLWIIASSLVSQVAIATRRGITSGRERTTKGVNIGGVLKISLSPYFSIPLSTRETRVIANEKSLTRDRVSYDLHPLWFFPCICVLLLYFCGLMQQPHRLKDFRELNGWREVVPEYIKDYVSINTFM